RNHTPVPVNSEHIGLVGGSNSTLRNLCVLCASAVKRTAKQVNRRGAEDAEITQRAISNWVTTAGQTFGANSFTMLHLKRLG
ncbi:MAG TPA: hypothetical protein VFS90_13405, partial [Pyrinomonadaceae bacterium]|nr:hypothetical protein [Pyrinomonadaceae bacterium]